MQMLSWSDSMQQRQRVILHAGTVLSGKSRYYGILSAVIKLIGIGLGALLASPLVSKELWPQNSDTILLVTGVCGVIVAIATGLEAAFKFEGKSAALRALAAQCQGAAFTLDREFQSFVQEFGSGQFQQNTEGHRRQEELNLIASAQAELLESVLGQSASTGFDLIGELKRQFPEVYEPA